jgi:hypothetical protein
MQQVLSARQIQNCLKQSEIAFSVLDYIYIITVNTTLFNVQFTYVLHNHQYFYGISMFYAILCHII